MSIDELIRKPIHFTSAKDMEAHAELTSKLFKSKMCQSLALVSETTGQSIDQVIAVAIATILRQVHFLGAPDDYQEVELNASV